MKVIEWSRLLAALCAGLLVAMLVATLVAVLPVAYASHVPDELLCLDDDGDLKHPTNTPTSGDDKIVGTPERDILAGGAGNDVIEGLGGSDVLCGNEGNDTIKGGGGDVFEAGKDVIRGGLGDDDLGGGTFTAEEIGQRCNLVEPASWSGDAGETTGVNYIFGDAGSDSIMGAGGRDGLHGDDGNDCLYALNGNDYITGGSGAEEIEAGRGDDTAVGQDDYDRIFAEDGNDNLYAGSSDVQVPEWPQTCEKDGELRLVLGPAESGDAAFIPGKTQNYLIGGYGYDDLFGAARNDWLVAYAGGDDLYGFGGNDELDGDSGADCLSGGPGDDVLDDADHAPVVVPDDTDTLWGGAGNDFLNALDVDSLDKLDGARWDFDTCWGDPEYPEFNVKGDHVIRCHP